MDMSWAMDIICVFLIFAGIYLGFKRGMLLGIYNLIAVLIITIIVVHNYIYLTDFVREKLPSVPPLYGDFLSFSAFLIALVLIAWIFKGILSFFLSSDEMGRPEKVFGAILGLFSGTLLTALWMMALYLSPWQNVESSISNGAVSKRLVFLPGFIYSVAVDYIIRPIDKKFPANMTVYSPTKQDQDSKKDKPKTDSVSSQPINEAME